MATDSTRRKETFYLEIRANTLAEVKLPATAFSADLKTALGMKDTAAETDAIVGNTKAEALESGCVPVILVYQVSKGKLQTARVLCAPSKADTIFTDAVGTRYRGKQIVKVRFPRRRVYVI